jgi:hypothetical protein
VKILCLADNVQKVRQVILLCEARQLRDIFEPDVYEAADTRPPKRFKELAGGFLGEAVRIDFHVWTLQSGKAVKNL